MYRCCRVSCVLGMSTHVDSQCPELPRIQCVEATADEEQDNMERVADDVCVPVTLAALEMTTSLVLRLGRQHGILDTYLLGAWKAI